MDCMLMFSKGLSGGVLGNPVWGCHTERIVYALVYGCTSQGSLYIYFLA